MDSVNDRIWEAMYRYLAIDLGVQRAVAESRATAEVNGNMRRCDELADAGFVFKERRFLDIGAGLGGLSVELVKHGAKVIAVEPARAWCSLIAERLRETGGYTIRAVGEALPISDNSVDYVVSLQVLEHVQDPEQVIREAFRVLKPGGHIFIAYENYRKRLVNRVAGAAGL